jgi:hypothetical protein
MLLNYPFLPVGSFSMFFKNSKQHAEHFYLHKMFRSGYMARKVDQVQGHDCFKAFRM